MRSGNSTGFDVIDGWTAVPQGETVYFVKNDNSASWSVMFGEVPGGWNGYEIDETSVWVEKDDESASMYVEFADLDGWEADDLAEFYAKEYNAKDLKKEDSTYTFSYEEDGWLNAASLGSDGKVYVLVINTAYDKAGFDAIAKLRGAIKRK
ncbi:MAG: hypothetical protein IJG51_02855 [Synergistaceae bacterium]|nr:hypothetical protein [Synergistaceae bacterium]MBQ3397810.1 hypothetical protein [Synergistaceae bacterium]MBQ6417498.1 hypothetical protein [Synergistaceae bacterium]MBQ6983091.1 hypothetical protein [Synergistaceae bacterium]